MSCPTKVQSALKKLDWIDASTMGASRVTTQVWFKPKSGKNYDENALKAAITKAGSNYSFAGLVKSPAGEKPAEPAQPATGATGG
ncbi:MAG: hypothetical protein ACKOS8_00290 [Gemmataceae bacterium]